MGLRNRVSIRLLAGLLFFGALCIGVADRSHATTIGYIDAGEAGASAAPLPASINRVEDQPVCADGASALVSKTSSTPQFQTGGFSAITRAILHIRYCVCSGVRQLLTSSSPVSTESTAPVTPLPAAPAAMFLFMTGLVTVVGVARRSHSGLLSSSRASLPVETPRIPLPGYLLLVSNDTRFVQGLATCFIRYGYVVESVLNTAQAGSLAAQQAPALVLLDRRQADWQMLRQASPFQYVPMMTLVPSGLGVTDEACAGDLESGMDSTHVCDESPRLLVAKIRALLRRSAWLVQAPTVVRAGQVELDIDRCEVRVTGQAHHLPPVQFKLLKRLMESPGKVFRRQELLDHIWGEGYAVEGHTLDVHVCWLRRLLAHDPTRRQTITTVRGVGIKFVADILPDESTRICGAWPSKTVVRRSRIPQRRATRRLRVVKPVAMRAAV